MAATRAALSAVPSTRAPRRAADLDVARPDLRVVPPRRPTGAIVAVALVLVFGVLLATAALNTMLVSGQRDLDRMETEIRAGEQRNRALALEVAELEAPERIRDAALADGMVEPEQVTWVAPQPDGTTDAVTAPAGGSDVRAEGETEADVAPDDGTQGATDEERADGAPEGADGAPDGADGLGG